MSVDYIAMFWDVFVDYIVMVVPKSHLSPDEPQKKTFLQACLMIYMGGLGLHLQASLINPADRKPFISSHLSQAKTTLSIRRQFLFSTPLPAQEISPFKSV